MKTFKVSHLQTHLLVDDTELVWTTLSQAKGKEKLVDIVMDNAGFELFADLCFAGILITLTLLFK